MTDTCRECGRPIDGDLATRTSDGRCICTVCFFDPERMVASIEAAREVFDISEIEPEIRATFDTYRGQAIRRRAKRDAEKGSA
jgi:hypothetical protein